MHPFENAIRKLELDQIAGVCRSPPKILSFVEPLDVMSHGLVRLELTSTIGATDTSIRHVANNIDNCLFEVIGHQCFIITRGIS